SGPRAITSAPTTSIAWRLSRRRAVPRRASGSPAGSSKRLRWTHQDYLRGHHHDSVRSRAAAKTVLVALAVFGHSDPAGGAVVQFSLAGDPRNPGQRPRRRGIGSHRGRRPADW